jgi:phosphatidylinositol alpha-1,6-mannosyltransferase
MLRPVRVLTLTPDFPPSVGGIQVLLERLVNNLPQHEHLVVARGPSDEREPTPTVRTRLPHPRCALAELQPLAVAAARRFRPEVVLNGHVVTTPGALAVRRLYRAPVVTYAYADEVPGFPGPSRLAMRRSRRVIAISGYAAELCRDHGARAGQLRLVAPGVDQRELRRTGSGRPTIVTVARLADRYKGHDVVLDALPAIREAVPGVRWVVVGDGPLRGELEARAQRNGVGAVVEFRGRVSDEERDRAMAEADVFVMPSRLPPGGAGGEGFGIVYLEAALAALPVVAGNVAGAVDAVEHDATGLLVDPASPAAVGQALTRLLNDAELARRLGEAGRRRARTFTWQRMAEQVDAVLHEAVSG